jgi:hypothetical protein
MHFFMKALRVLPWRCWSSAPNLQVTILSLAVAAYAGGQDDKAANMAAARA